MGRHIECFLQKKKRNLKFFYMFTWHEVVHFENVLFFFYRFINARRRIVQPMIDQSNRAGKSPVVTVFKSRRCKSSTSQSPPDISPGNHGNDVFDTGGWKHGKKENEQNCHGDKKLKKIVSETFWNAIHFLNNSAAIVWLSWLLNADSHLTWCDWPIREDFHLHR